MKTLLRKSVALALNGIGIRGPGVGGDTRRLLQSKRVGRI